MPDPKPTNADKAFGRRWDEAVDMLINGRHVPPEIAAAFFAYADGEITKEEARKVLL